MIIVKRIGLVIITLIVLISIVSLFFPTEKVISRTAIINTPVENVFQNVNSMENWKKWGGPWHEDGMDYNKVIQKTEGLLFGVGSKLIYNQGKGDGSVEIIESKKNKRIKTLISFEDGGFANGIWLFNQNNSSTNVSWTIHVNLGYNPIKRIIGNFILENKVGHVFEIGLSNLKKVSE